MTHGCIILQYHNQDLNVNIFYCLQMFYNKYLCLQTFDLILNVIHTLVLHYAKQ